MASGKAFIVSFVNARGVLSSAVCAFFAGSVSICASSSSEPVSRLGEQAGVLRPVPLLLPPPSHCPAFPRLSLNPPLNLSCPDPLRLALW